MPWWGWLILVCVLLIAAAWVTVAVVAAKAARGVSDSFNKNWEV